MVGVARERGAELPDGALDVPRFAEEEGEAEVGSEVDVIGLLTERGLVPASGFLEPLGVEVRVPQADEHVERIIPSRTTSPSTSARKDSRSESFAKASRSRTFTGAVL